MSSFSHTFRVLSIGRDDAEYERLFAETVKGQSVFNSPDYLKAALIGEGYPVCVMVYSEQGRFAMCTYVVRRINDLTCFHDLNMEVRDIISPYEYSSILSNASDEMDYDRLTERLFDSVAEYCRGNNIVSEFVRFDPFLSEAGKFSGSYNVKKSCDNIYIDLAKPEGEIFGELHSSVRKNLNTAWTAGLSFSQVEADSGNIDRFTGLYHETMQRRSAKSYFYFSSTYFHALLTGCEDASLFFVSDSEKQPVSASILLHRHGGAYHHLTGYAASCQHARPNDLMVCSLSKWCKEQSFSYLHLGGGAASICDFKGKFSRSRVPYYVGRRIHNLDFYRQLCKIRQDKDGIDPDSEFFPLYRIGS
ncbi:MAG: GNAT family N-acetyltransferase [Geobacteraceae bacterium]|nr:GNAT family N-acetyltransferase [Geobacteraceae bacterium]